MQAVNIKATPKCPRGTGSPCSPLRNGVRMFELGETVLSGFTVPIEVL